MSNGGFHSLSSLVLYSRTPLIYSGCAMYISRRVPSCVQARPLPLIAKRGLRGSVNLYRLSEYASVRIDALNFSGFVNVRHRTARYRPAYGITHYREGALVGVGPCGCWLDCTSSNSQLLAVASGFSTYTVVAAGLAVHIIASPKTGVERCIITGATQTPPLPLIAKHRHMGSI